MKKSQAAFLSIVSNAFLVILKTITGILTGSVAVLSEALNSATDIVASLLAYFSIKQAEKPADSTHPFGHGKFENISSLVESFVIMAVAVIIIYEAIIRFIKDSVIELPIVGIIVMMISGTVKFTVSGVLHGVAKRTDSIALEAESRNLRMDVYTNLAVLLGLIMITLTGKVVIDSLLAIAVSLLIMTEGFRIFRKSLSELLDRSLPDEEISVIMDVLNAHKDFIKDYHDLRTRKAGSERHIDLHLTVCQRESIADTHNTMDSIEKEI
jgi:cation diffusion facilitator family transporter